MGVSGLHPRGYKGGFVGSMLSMPLLHPCLDVVRADIAPLRRAVGELHISSSPSLLVLTFESSEAARITVFYRTHKQRPNLTPSLVRHVKVQRALRCQ